MFCTSWTSIWLYRSNWLPWHSWYWRRFSLNCSGLSPWNIGNSWRFSWYSRHWYCRYSRNFSFPMNWTTISNTWIFWLTILSKLLNYSLLCFDCLGGLAIICLVCLDLQYHRTVQIRTVPWVIVTRIIKTAAVIRRGERISSIVALKKCFIFHYSNTFLIFYLRTVRHPVVNILSEKVFAKSEESVALACSPHPGYLNVQQESGYGLSR